MEEAKQPVQKEFNLTPLTPEFNEDNHGSYVRRVNQALKEPKIRNIALSGTYGIGKSSILQKVAEEHEKDVVEISLSTLAPAAPNEVDENIPRQASTTTNRIQQEIVKNYFIVSSHTMRHALALTGSKASTANVNIVSQRFQVLFLHSSFF